MPVKKNKQFSDWKDADTFANNKRKEGYNARVISPADNYTVRVLGKKKERTKKSKKSKK